MSETWLERHSRATEAFGASNNVVFVSGLVGLGLEQQLRTLEPYNCEA